MSLVRTRPGGRQAPPPSAPAARASYWALPAGIALVVSLLVGGFAIIASADTLLYGPSTEAEWSLFGLTLFVLLPAALTAGHRVAGTLAGAGGPAAVSAVGARAATALLLILLLSRVAPTFFDLSSSAVLLPLTVAWGLALAVVVRRAGRWETSGKDPSAGGDGRWWTLAAALGCLSALAFLSPELWRPAALGGSLAIGGALSALHARLRRPSRLRWVPPVADAVVVSLVILTLTDVSSYLEYRTALAPELAQVMLWGHRIHQGFWLGAVNDVLHGRALLVDTSSQYGVGVVYALAAFFHVAPLGYGALALLSGFLTALQYALVYIVMRLAGCSRTLAVPALVVAVVLALWPAVGLAAVVPSAGALRYGIAWLVVALAVLWTRCPRGARPLRAAASALVGLASVWSFETFAYVGATFTAVALFEAGALEPGQRRLRAFARFMLAAAGCSVVAHLALAVGTRAFAGTWPDWSMYLAFLQAYAGSSVSFWYQPVKPWSPGLPVFLFYLASAISLAGLLARNHVLVRERRPLLVGIAATSGLGIASFSYFVGLSGLIFVALPAVVLGALWIALVDDRLLRAPRAARLLAAPAGFWIAALVVVWGWPFATANWQPTALAHLSPTGGSSLVAALPRLWSSPPSDARALEAQGLLDRRLPPGEPALVILEPELSVETLVRSGRPNVLPISHPEQENLVPDKANPKVLAVVDRLRPGTLLLTQPDEFDARVKRAGVQPFSSPGLPTYTGGKLIRLQKLALDRLRARFRLEEVERSRSGLVLMRMGVARRGRR